jgi:hypothetical protein
MSDIYLHTIFSNPYLSRNKNHSNILIFKISDKHHFDKIIPIFDIAVRE